MEDFSRWLNCDEAASTAENLTDDDQIDMVTNPNQTLGNDEKVSDEEEELKISLRKG